MRLLFCEDEYLTRIGVMQTIPWKEIGISEVECAKNGLEGIEKIRNRPEILLTDIRMPHRTGLEIAARLKEQDPDSEVIIMSSYSDKEYLKTAISLSTVAYIEKPLDLAELQEALKQAVSRRKKAMRLREMDKKEEEKQTFSCMPDPENPAFSHAVRMVLREIRDHYQDVNLSVDSLSEIVHFSPVYLGSSFKEETGTNIRPLICSVRLEAACRLLRETNLPIVRIAEMTGFNSSNYFSRQFRQNLKVSPNEYRDGKGREGAEPV